MREFMCRRRRGTVCSVEYRAVQREGARVGFVAPDCRFYDGALGSSKPWAPQFIANSWQTAESTRRQNLSV